ncbi:MAG: hypothetical protein KDD45_03100 [Bdellovibrionales bacterium]|nr:hypothetical protein [Bdellovibrionales bacterium]
MKLTTLLSILFLISACATTYHGKNLNIENQKPDNSLSEYKHFALKDASGVGAKMGLPESHGYYTHQSLSKTYQKVGVVPPNINHWSGWVLPGLVTASLLANPNCNSNNHDGNSCLSEFLGAWLIGSSFHYFRLANYNEKLRVKLGLDKNSVPKAWFEYVF